MDNVVGFIKGIIKTEAARLIAYSSAAAVGVALFVAEKMGAELSPEFLSGVAAFATVVATEAIRHFVFSEESVEKIVEEVQEEAETP